ncbi:MAG: TAT-variant-translocated molybdopterin oxidoreductase [Planctomycetota bacterium]|nr:TAT-variant-translocated molybdopterin oxidoreductase [Planctomycetota bacterium]
MTHDQCPSTRTGEKAKPGKAQLARVPRIAGTVNGLPVWRSPEELGDEAAFRDWLEREFPAGASELDRAEIADAGDPSGTGETRRTFLKLMGASVALAGAATIPGCRRPEHPIMPYSRVVPEEVVPGKPLYYATSWARPDGGVEGLLVETHEGRPTKIEGNPLHPASRGKCTSWALSSILSLYDPDRLKNPVYRNPTRGQVGATWDDFRVWGASHFAPYDASKGEGLAFVVAKSASPTRRAVCARLRQKYPNAMWVDWAPAESPGPREGTRAALGAPCREVLHLGRDTAEVILSLDHDFLEHVPDQVRNSLGFASSRSLGAPNPADDTMSRLYMVESGFSITGAQADHRVPMAPSRISGFAVELARFMLPKVGAADAAPLATALGAVQTPAGEDLGGARAFLEACAKDLMDPARRGRAVVTAGPSQPPEVHALIVAINAALGSIGVGVSYVAMTPDEAADGHADLARLTAAMKDGAISTLVCVGANPVYDAPGALDFAGAMAKVGATVTLSVELTETALASTWMLNAASYLESWGDTISSEGVIAPVQPMIAPLYEPALCEIEFLALLAGTDWTARIDGFEIVRAHWRGVVAGTDGAFAKAWRAALHEGIGPVVAPAARTRVDYASVAQGVSRLTLAGAPGAEALDVAFGVGNLADGRLANIGWLQELPAAGTRVVWDNPVLMSPRTAEALGVAPVGFSRADDMGGVYTSPKYPTARLAKLTLAGREVVAPVWILPGMPDFTLRCTLGYGRTAAGRVGDGVGVNFYAVLPATGRQSMAGGTLRREPGSHMIASTQNHWSMESRTSIVRAVDLPAWQKHGTHVQKTLDTFYANEGKVRELNFAEMLGELSHTPPNISIYENPFNRSHADPDPKDIGPAKPDGPAYQSLQPPVYTQGPQWAMTIDQTLCTGCGACTIACQAENNIPVVGKKEVAKGREMAWIRVDRYFTGDMDNPGAMLHQPVACVHCENAPCEVVCPVNATVHGPEGLNYMTYNRCIGTRYCANNCPYKVRRFNFFDYGVTKFNGDYFFKEFVDDAGGMVPGQEGITGSGAYNKINPNLIPPRLREKLDQISRMQKNPNVTVRSRGVMEKCTYCIQRINAGRIEIKLKGLEKLPDGFVQAACQQACPSDAIVFGDMLDPASRVARTRANARSYELLGYLNTRPRTSHMVRVMNPNPALCDAARKDSWEHPFHHAGGHGESHNGHNGHGHDGHGHDEPGHDGHAPPTPPQSFRFDGRRRREDRGYALSLTVLHGRKA